jgi:hypothetical protein
MEWFFNRRPTQTNADFLRPIRIPWKLHEKLLADKNKQASSYPPTALVSTQSVGHLRSAECFQEIL